MMFASLSSQVFAIPALSAVAARVFVLLARDSTGGAPGALTSVQPRLMLRAESAAARDKWLQAIVVATSQRLGHEEDDLSEKTPDVATPTSAGTPVGRRISTKVFDESDQQQQKEGGDQTAGSDLEEAIDVAAIASNDAKQQEDQDVNPSPDICRDPSWDPELLRAPSISAKERAALELIIPVVSDYVHARCSQLAEQMGKVQ